MGINSMLSVFYAFLFMTRGKLIYWSLMEHSWIMVLFYQLHAGSTTQQGNSKDIKRFSNERPSKQKYFSQWKSVRYIRNTFSSLQGPLLGIKGQSTSSTTSFRCSSSWNLALNHKKLTSPVIKVGVWSFSRWKKFINEGKLLFFKIIENYHHKLLLKENICFCPAPLDFTWEIHEVKNEKNKDTGETNIFLYLKKGKYLHEETTKEKLDCFPFIMWLAHKHLFNTQEAVRRLHGSLEMNPTEASGRSLQKVSDWAKNLQAIQDFWILAYEIYMRNSKWFYAEPYY